MAVATGTPSASTTSTRDPTGTTTSPSSGRTSGKASHTAALNIYGGTEVDLATPLYVAAHIISQGKSQRKSVQTMTGKKLQDSSARCGDHATYFYTQNFV